MAPQVLSAKQAHALLDILSHDEVYNEIQDFRFPGALEQYGPPFETMSGKPSTTPSLQTMVSRFVLGLPGLRDVEDSFWNERVAAMIKGFERAELSESYDKGSVGIRRTLATAISALAEYPVRGVLAGFDEPSEHDKTREYDLTKAEDLQHAFKNALHQTVYGSMIDDLIARVRETDNLSAHTPLIQATHEYIVVNIASFMHYTLIISPKGQPMLTLIDNANKLVPYTLIKQTLKIGNVATMINAMVKVVLAKLSMGSVSNWIGWTSGADEGMNLLQHIISQVLHWDIRDLKHRATKIEKEKQAPNKEQLEAISDYLRKSRSDRDGVREKSRTESKPIVAAILSEASQLEDMSEAQHKLSQDYLAVQLAVRDREQIVNVLCHSQPDHLTQSVRDLVNAYEPLIRQIHNAVDLSGTVTDFEVFLKDTIKLAKVSENRGRIFHKGSSAPTVGDFVQLLKKHQSSCHRFLHQVVKNGPELTSWYHDYALKAVSNFRRSATQPPNPPSTTTEQPNAGDLTGALNDLFNTLPEEAQARNLKILDKRAAYLSSLHAASARRLHNVITSPSSDHPVFRQNSGLFRGTNSQPGSRSSSPTPGAGAAPSTGGAAPPTSSTIGLDANPGPGAFLARWQALIDASEITPTYKGDGLRTGGRGSVLRASRMGVDSVEERAKEMDESAGTVEEQEREDEDIFEEAHERLDQSGLEDGEKTRPPDTRELVEMLAPGYREMIAKRECTW